MNCRRFAPAFFSTKTTCKSVEATIKAREFYQSLPAPMNLDPRRGERETHAEV
jgi:hypothetical protein